MMMKEGQQAGVLLRLRAGWYRSSNRHTPWQCTSSSRLHSNRSPSLQSVCHGQLPCEEYIVCDIEGRSE